MELLKKLRGAIKWPFEDGKKTSRGLILLGLSALIRLFGDHLPHQPSTEELEIVVTHGEAILNSIAGILEIFGGSLAALGVTHKSAKAVVKKAAGANDPTTPQWE